VQLKTETGGLCGGGRGELGGAVNLVIAFFWEVSGGGSPQVFRRVLD
jgi:hypothetical protein